MSENYIYVEKAIANNVNRCISQTLSAIDNATLRDENTDYKSLYYFLFNGISDILALKSKFTDITCDRIHLETIEALKKLQCNAEELFLKQTE